MSITDPTLAAAIAARGVPLSADYAPQPATPRWHQARTELIRTFRDYMPETAATKAVDLLDEVITEALLDGTTEAKLRKIEHGCETPESHLYGCPCQRTGGAS